MALAAVTMRYRRKDLFLVVVPILFGIDAAIAVIGVHFGWVENKFGVLAFMLETIGH